MQEFVAKISHHESSFKVNLHFTWAAKYTQMKIGKIALLFFFGYITYHKEVFVNKRFVSLLILVTKQAATNFKYKQ